MATLRARTVDFQELWSTVETHVVDILADPFRSAGAGGEMRMKLSRLYNHVYRLASNPAVNLPRTNTNGPQTIEFQCQVLREELQNVLQRHLEHVRSQIMGYDLELIKSYLRQWEVFCFAVKLISIIFNYAHGQWKRSAHGHSTPTDTGALASSLWVLIVVNPLKESLTQCLLGQVASDRRDEPIDRNTMRVMLLSLSYLSSHVDRSLDRRPHVYLEVFEQPFLEATEAHYNAESERLLSEHGVREYLHFVRQLLSEESHRMTFLHTTSYSPLKKVLINTLIERRLSMLVKDAGTWLDQNDIDALERLFFCLQQSETCLDPLRRLFEDRVDSNGKEEIQKCISEGPARDPVMLVNRLLIVYQRYYEMLVTVFKDNKNMRLAFTAGLRKVINRNAMTETQDGKNYPGKTAEALARYCNLLLRPGSPLNKNIQDMHHFEHIVKHILILFKELEERDVFQVFYANLMCNRLIYGNFSDEKELLILQKFKEVCGHEFTYKWQRMYNDATNQLSGEFSEFLTNGQIQRPFELTPMVLTSGSWPNTGNAAFEEDLGPSVPPSLSTLCQHFLNFYRNVGQGKKLRWMHNYSHGTVKTGCHFEKKRIYDLIVSEYQLCFLSMFNTDAEDPVVAFADYFRATNTKDKGLIVRQLQPLIKCRLIIAEPAGAPEHEQTFKINPGFFNPNRKLTVLPVMTAAPGGNNKDGDESDQVQQKVKVERKYAIQAAIVRLMKSRRTMEYKDILSETFGMLKAQFSAQVPQIKENLEILIEKEYVERSAEDSNKFVYLA